MNTIVGTLEKTKSREAKVNEEFASTADATILRGTARTRRTKANGTKGNEKEDSKEHDTTAEKLDTQLESARSRRRNAKAKKRIWQVDGEEDD